MTPEDKQAWKEYWLNPWWHLPVLCFGVGWIFGMFAVLVILELRK